MAYDVLGLDVDPGFRLVPVVPSRKPSMTSGPLIARMIQKHVRVREHWIIEHKKVHESDHFIVFIDDFIGTGSQFIKFVERNEYSQLVEDKKCCFLSLAGHSSGDFEY